MAEASASDPAAGEDSGFFGTGEFSVLFGSVAGGLLDSSAAPLSLAS
ncbi:hypothetical protein [Brevibacterium aurantiacum]|nr:hypothetical protein [Brevibacterium aurantiacum]MDN5774076.1 hypothetical protein [Brevibacterium aurantiacum]